MPGGLVSSLSLTSQCEEQHDEIDAIMAEAIAYAVADAENQYTAVPIPEATPSSTSHCVTPPANKTPVADVKLMESEYKY